MIEPDPTWGRWKLFWNKNFHIRVKHMAYCVFVLTVGILANQHQLDALQDARFRTVCEARIESRGDLIQTLDYIVDLSDVFPDNEAAEAYTKSRDRYIEDRLAPITEKDCA